MKKNITINMYGALYAIDEDAYDLLNQYQSHMRRYFSHKDGGEEIAEDIERRVAELFAELKASGVEAITMEHVQDIIARIGNPEEMDGEGESLEESGKEEHKGNVRKKLFRNPDDKMLGGVASGMASYFGIDALWVRLLWILLTWFSGGIIVLVYLILLVIVPEACTPEDRLRMQGRPVNMKNLRDEIMQGARKAGKYATAPETRKGCLNRMFELFAVVLKGCLVIVVCGILLFCIAALFFVFIILGLYGLAGLMNLFIGLPMPGFLAGHDFQGHVWMVVFSFTVLVSTTLFIGIHTLMRMAGRVRSLTSWKRVALVVVWIASAIALVFSFVPERITQSTREHSLRARRELNVLESEGWKVLRHEHCDTYVKSGEYYIQGKGHLQYIDAWSRSPEMAYELERTVRVSPGTYRLEAAARTDGRGCEIFAISGNKERRAEVPAYGDEGGEIWQEVQKFLHQGAAPAGMDIMGIKAANKGKGYGWSRVAIDGIVVGTDSVVRYGVSNVRSGRWDGTWFSATDFDLERVTEK